MPQAYEIANPDNIVNVTESSYAITSGNYAFVGETAEETPSATHGVSQEDLAYIQNQNAINEGVIDAPAETVTVEPEAVTTDTTDTTTTDTGTTTTEDEPTPVMSDEFENYQQQTAETLNDIYAGIQGFTDQVTSLNENFLETRQTFLDSLGELGTDFTEQLVALEEDLGVQIDTSNEDLQTEITAAYEAGASEEEIKAILSKAEYQVGAASEQTVVPTKAVSEATQEILDQVSQAGILSAELLTSATNAYDAGSLSEEEYSSYLERFTPDATTSVVEAASETGNIEYTQTDESTLISALDSYSELDYSSLSSTLTSFLSGDQDLSTMSSAEMNQILLAQIALDSTSEVYNQVSAIYASQEARYAEVYASAEANYATATDEIEAIISGTSDTATTMESLAVRVAEQTQELSLASAEAQEMYLTAEYEYTYGQMSEQNARLEGYMKAKLNYMGAETSSAGLSLMATTINNAQATLLLYQTQYSAEMIEMEANKTAIMSDYYNAVTEQLINVESNKSSALTSYYEALDTIELNQITSLQEMNTSSLNTLTDLTNNLYTIQTDQMEWEYGLATDAYNRAVDAAAVVREVESTAKTEATNNLSTLIDTYAGQSWDSIPSSVQTSMLEYATAIGLPVEALPQTLAVEQEPGTWSYNNQLSEQLGYLVGTDSNGNVVPLDQLSSSASGDMVTMSYSGDYAANCALYAREQYPSLPYGLDSIANRETWVDNYGFTAEEQQPQVGDVVQTSEGTWGHTAIIAGFTSDGSMILDEANYRSGTVTYGRELSIDSPNVIGFWTPTNDETKWQVKASSSFEGLEGVSPGGVETYSQGVIPYDTDEESDNLSFAAETLYTTIEANGYYTNQDLEDARSSLRTTEELQAFNAWVASEEVSGYASLQSEALEAEMTAYLETGTPEEIITRLEVDYGFSATEATDFLEGMGWEYNSDKKRWSN
jgi:hypothetical protein